MKGILNKTLVLALLVSATGMNAGIKETMVTLGSTAGRYCASYSKSFRDYVVSHPYAFGAVAAATILPELGIRSYNWYKGQDNGKNTPSRWIKNNPKKVVAGLGIVTGAGLAYNAGYVGVAADYVAPKLAAAGTFVTSNVSKAASKVAEVAAKYPTATKVVAGVAAITAVAGVTYGTVKAVQKHRKAKADAVALDTKADLTAVITAIKGLYNERGIVRNQKAQLAFDCKGLLNETDLTMFNSLVGSFNREITLTSLYSKSNIGKTIIALLEKANS